MESYLNRADPLGDEPSFRIIQSMLPGIENDILELQKFKKGSGSHDFSKLVMLEDGVVVEYSGQEPLPPLCDLPQRADGIVLTDENTLMHKNDDDLINSAECMLRFLHYVYFDVEINAMEVCARNIAEFREMPLEFKLDMAQQIWDEARHARFFSNKIGELGGHVGMFPVRMTVWNRYLMGSTLQERLAIEQIVQEGNSVETNIAFSNVLRANGQIAMANSFDFVNADEAVHARIGNKWLLYLCNNSPEEYMAFVSVATKAINWKIPGKAPLNPDTRMLSGFPSWFIAEAQKKTIGE